MNQLTVLFVLISVSFSSVAVENINVEQERQHEELLIIIPSDVKHDYELFLNGRDPLKINYFGGHYSRRDVVEEEGDGGDGE